MSFIRATKASFRLCSSCHPGVVVTYLDPVIDRSEPAQRFGARQAPRSKTEGQWFAVIAGCSEDKALVQFGGATEGEAIGRLNLAVYGRLAGPEWVELKAPACVRKSGASVAGADWLNKQMANDKPANDS